MTEKRFKLIELDENNAFVMDKVEDKSLAMLYELVDKMNEFNEENKKLKLKKQELEISLLNNQLAYNSLMNENEELKNIIKEVKEWQNDLNRLL